MKRSRRNGFNLLCSEKKKSARYGPSAFLRLYNQIYPEKPLRLFGVLVLMLAERRE